MSVQGVERTPRAAYLDACMPPAGSSALMPPPSQEVERRTERRARRTRWGLRTLVVGGLAGAAWLLTGAAAHAADQTDEPAGSLLGSVVGGNAVSPAMDFLTAADQPLEFTGPAHEHRHHHNVADTVLDVPRQVLSHPARRHHRAGNDYLGSPIAGAVSAVDQALREIAAPIRLTGGTAATPNLLTAHVAETRKPAREKPPKPAASPVSHRVSSTSDKAAVPVVTGTTSSKVLHVPASAPRATAPASHSRTTTTRLVHRHHATASADVVPRSVRDEAPVGDGPAAPLQLRLGDASGSSTSGSGTPPEGGAPAFLPVALADSTMASHLLPVADTVEVRRHDAEAPTVSPD